MAWKQIRTPNLNIQYTGGWCLLAVRTAFGIDKAVYPTAMADWRAGEGGRGNHHELPPRGVAVPVYFSLGSEPAGHVAISLPDGQVASSTQSGTHQGLYIHPNLDDLIRLYAQYNKGCTYLGWSEGTENVAVVEYVADQGGLTTGGTQEVTFEEYASDILDVIEDNPHYAETKKEAFAGHVNWLKANPAWDKRRSWVKGIMANNGVLNATMMRQHLAEDQSIRNDRTRLASQVELQDQMIEGMQKEIGTQDQTLAEMTKTINQQKQDLAQAEATIATLKAAARSSDAVNALSALDLIGLGILKFLNISQPSKPEEVTKPND